MASTDINITQDLSVELLLNGLPSNKIFVKLCTLTEGKEVQNIPSGRT